MKIVAENMPGDQAAREAQVNIGVIDNIVYAAEQKGYLLKPASRIVRPASYRQDQAISPELLTSPAFTLQWHITQACDLSCRHCYDRSARATVTAR
jgi:transposase